MKKFVALVVMLLMIVSVLTACGGKPVVEPTPATETTPASAVTNGETNTTAPTNDSNAGTKKLKIGLCTSVGGLGDKSFNDQAYAGVTKAVNELGLQLDYVEPQDFSDIEPYLTEFAKAGTYDVIIGIGYDAAQPIKNVAPQYPDQKFLLVDNPIRNMSNVASLTFNKSEEGFLTGIFCAYFANMNQIEINGNSITLDNSKKVVGAILGMENPDIVEAIAGFRAGLKYIDPEVQVLYSAIGSWTDQNKARELAMAQYGEGATMVWQDAGNAGLGIFKAAADKELFSLGWNTPQHELDPAHIPCSVIKTLDNAIYEWIKSFATSGMFESGNKDNGCYNNSIYIAYSEQFSVPDVVKKAIDNAQGKLSTGEIVSPLTLEEVDAFTLRYEG